MDNLDRLFGNRPAVIAHRGANRHAPENTLAAFGRAFELGADGIELDVMLSRDRVPVVIHDPRVERTTDGSGNVRDLSWDELQRLDAGSWFGPTFRGTRIPRLEAVLEESRGRGWVNIELKNYDARGDGLEEVVTALVRRMRLEREVLLSSFNPLSLRQAARLAPELPRALLTMAGLPIFLRNGWFAFMARPDAYNLEQAQANARAVQAVHRRGARACVWTVNDPGVARRLRDAGMDGIISDEPDVILSALGRQEKV
jgi:glycerophosphoryl diester phosphodiesterase